MNLYEFEGRTLFQKHNINIPKGVVIRRGDDVMLAYQNLGLTDVVVKAQVLSGKRGKNNGIRFCSTAEEVVQTCQEIFDMQIRGQYVASILLTEKIDIAEEHYLSVTYDTNRKQPMLVYSIEGGMDIEDVPDEKIVKIPLDISQEKLNLETEIPYAQELWNCFLAEDTRVVEINPLVKTKSGEWIALDAKIALDDDAFYRHDSSAQERVKEKGKDPNAISNWEEFEPRTMMGRSPTEREVEVSKVDSGEKYYQGTAGKYIEMDGDIALILNGGGGSIANMDALLALGLKPANYTEYSGNPPREKVYALAKIVLSKPGLRGLWMCGAVANFTNMRETFLGIIDALDEIKPRYPIIVRRDGPESAEAFRLMEECAERNGLNIRLFDKEMGMTESAKVLASMVAEVTIK